MRTGAIVLPQYVDIGAAYTNDSDLSAWKVSDIDRIAETNGFSDAS